jgi:hypothetical protein
MTPLQEKLPGVRCLCKKHRGISLAYRFESGIRGEVVKIVWNGQTIKTLPFDVNVVSRYEDWSKENLPVSATCLMSVGERKRSVLPQP